MSELMGLWEIELERVVQRLQKGGSVRTKSHDGRQVIVRVKRINPGRCGPNDIGYV